MRIEHKDKIFRYMGVPVAQALFYTLVAVGLLVCGSILLQWSLAAMFFADKVLYGGLSLLCVIVAILIEVLLWLLYE